MDVRGLVELTRPGNAVAAGVLTLIGAYVVAGAAGLTGTVEGALGVASPATAVATLATVLAVGAGNAINDYFDREIDAINKPDRPIPRGAVSPRGALRFAVALFLAAVALALTLPVIAIAIAAVNLVALVAYTEFFKGLPGVGNALVAYLTGSTFLFGGAAVGGTVDGLFTVGVLGVLAAVATLTREIVKDVEDVAGDREEGLNTLPIAVGERTALHVATAFMLAAVLASPAPYLRGTFGVAYLAVVVPADLVMVGATLEAYRDPAASQSHVKYGMFLAAAAFVVGRAFV